MTVPGDTAGPPDRGTRGGRGPALWLGVALFLALASALGVALVEWPHYRGIVEWRELRLGAFEALVLAGAVWSNAQLVLLPLLGLTLYLNRRGFRRAATWLLFAGVGSVLVFVLIDLWTQLHFGTNAWTFVPFAWDAMTSSTPNHWQWAGDWRDLAGSALRFLGPILAVGLAIAALSGLLARSAARLAQGRPRLLPATLAAHAALVLAPVLLLGPLANRVAVQRLDWALPLPSGARTARALWDALVGVARPRPAVRIVSLVPRPNMRTFVDPEVTLYNPGRKPVSLAGWQLVSSSRRSVLPLAGNIGAGGSRRVVIPAQRLTLSELGDRLSLLDRAGAEVCTVSYEAKDVDNGSLIVFQDESGLDGYLHEVTVGLEGVYAWGQGGLVLDRHDSESNTSHLGTFALLYGRSPLLYEQVLGASIPPQVTVTLRRAGYQSRFFSAGFFGGWKRMDLFVNQANFDELVFLPNPAKTYWTGWPDGDRRVLELARQALTTSDRPQFLVLFLMSTHYPYPYPQEYERFTPALPSMGSGGWTGNEIDQLRNRYRNSAGFLDDAVWTLISSVDPARNLFIVTGDHGESLGEDGAVTHGSRPSEIQTRVPFLMVGPGVPSARIDGATHHSDVLPTLIHALRGGPAPIAGAQGRDLLSGPPGDEAYLLKPLSKVEPGELVLVRGGERLLVRYSSGSPEIEALSFVDDAGYPVVPAGYSRTPPSSWVSVFRDQMVRLTLGR